MSLLFRRGWFWVPLFCFGLSFGVAAQTDTEQPEVPDEGAPPVETLGEFESGGETAAGGGTETIPEGVRRPRKGEAPRYPKDLVIGVLGPGEAPEEAYRYARNLLRAVFLRMEDSEYLADMDSGFKESVFTSLESLGVRKYRIGAGKEEPDGAASFLFRFIGREQDITGELYLRQEEENWQFDDLIMEEPQVIAERRTSYQYDFSPYERFF